MMVEVTRNELIFSSGKKVYINGGVIGISRGDDVHPGSLELSYGYDGGIPLPEDTWARGNSNRLTPSECVELAEEMLRRWAEFRDKYQAYPAGAAG